MGVHRITPEIARSPSTSANVAPSGARNETSAASRAIRLSARARTRAWPARPAPITASDKRASTALPELAGERDPVGDLGERALGALRIEDERARRVRAVVETSMRRHLVHRSVIEETREQRRKLLLEFRSVAALMKKQRNMRAAAHRRNS